VSNKEKINKLHESLKESSKKIKTQLITTGNIIKGVPYRVEANIEYNDRVSPDPYSIEVILDLGKFNSIRGGNTLINKSFKTQEEAEAFLRRL